MSPTGMIDQLAAIDCDTLLNVVLALVPMLLIAVKQTMIISASITAYSTAVGPSSETKNC